MVELRGDKPATHNATQEAPENPLFNDYLTLTRAGEVGADGKPIFVTPPTKPMPESVLAKEIGAHLKEDGDARSIMPSTQYLLSTFTDADDIENSLDWLKDKLDKQLEKTPWSVDFKYDRDNDFLEVTTTNKEDPTKNLIVGEPREHAREDLF
ncbi:hypothetical protein BH11CYA1_BH11CYA1_10490 [soil metagenome]